MTRSRSPRGCRPGGPRSTVDVGPIPEHPAWRLARFDALRGVMVANTPPEPHWYLNLLATHPDWQRQGLGDCADGR